MSPLGPSALLGPGAPPEPAPGLLSAQSGAFRAPDALIGALVPAELRESVESLRRDVSEVAGAVGPDGLRPLEASALRMLTVHAWRRIALRLPRLPAELWPDGWEGEVCRADVHRLLGRLPRPALGVLEAAARAPRGS